jgi:hypothetical protein
MDLMQKACEEFVSKFKSLSMKDMQQTIKIRGMEWFLTGLELCQRVGCDLPEGSQIRTLIRVIGTADTVRRILFPQTESPVVRYANAHGLIKQRSSSFVYMFFNTDLHTLFKTDTVRISEYTTLTDVECELGRFVFVKSDWSDEYSDIYYMKPNINMKELLDGLWGQYNGRIFVAINYGRYQSTQIDFTTFDSLSTPLFGNASSLMDKMITRHKLCMDRGVPRSYMFYGPPGTGKSSFANTFANKLGERVLKLNAASLTCASIKDVSFLIENLLPDFLIIDDVDKVVIGNSLPTLLEILQKFKSTKTTIMMTVNSIYDLDHGLLRPGRIDTWVEFALPKLEERKMVLNSYAQANGITIEERDLSTLARGTSSMSQDYLRELIGELKRSESIKEVTELAKTMKHLLGLKELADEEEAKKEEEAAKKELADASAKVKETKKASTKKAATPKKKAVTKKAPPKVNGSSSKQPKNKVATKKASESK